jgi:hypothetical protein
VSTFSILLLISLDAISIPDTSNDSKLSHQDSKLANQEEGKTHEDVSDSQ